MSPIRNVDDPLEEELAICRLTRAQMAADLVWLDELIAGLEEQVDEEQPLCCGP